MHWQGGLILTLALALLLPVAAKADPIPVAVETLIRTADREGDAVAFRATVAMARKAFPASEKEIGTLAKTLQAAAARRHRIKLSRQGFFQGWKGQGQVGAGTTTGNSKSTTLSLGLAFNREGLKWNHALTATIDTLFPDGGSIFLASYRAESGNTERVERLLESPEGAEAKAALKSIPVQKGETALDTVQLWISAGDELGKLENKKTARAAALQSAAPPAQRVVQQARSQWIKVAGLIVANAEVSDAPAATVSAVTHSLLSAAAGAGGRGARKGSPEQPPAPAEPASPADGSAAPPK